MMLVSQEDLSVMPNGTVFATFQPNPREDNILDISGYSNQAWVKLGHDVAEGIPCASVVPNQIHESMYTNHISKIVRGTPSGPPLYDKTALSPGEGLMFVAFEPDDMMHLAKTLTQSFSPEQMNELFATRGMS